MRPTEPAPPSVPQERYPWLEGFIERAAPGDIPALFAPVRQALAELKGPRAEQGKRVAAALDRAEELLGILLETREKLGKARPGRR